MYKELFTAIHVIVKRSNLLVDLGTKYKGQRNDFSTRTYINF